MKNSALITPAPAPVTLKKALDEEIIMWIQLKIAKARKDVVATKLIKPLLYESLSTDIHR